MSRVVATGCGAVCPLGGSVEELGEGVLAGRSGAAVLEGPAWEGHPVRVACPLGRFEAALPVPDRGDRSARLARAAALQAVERARWPREAAPRTSVILGSARGPIGSLESLSLERVSPRAVEQTMIVAPASAVTQDLGLGGASFVISATCASSAHALGVALQQLRSGAADFVLAGGTEAPLVPGYLRAVWASGVLSRDGTCRPFDRRRSGTLMGEGAVVFLLEREETALRRDAPPLFELAGYGASSDAGRLHCGSPDGRGVAAALLRALKDARLTPGGLAFIYAHATGTPAGDPAEAAGIRRALGKRALAVPTSSTKGLTGHLAGASAALSAAIAGLALRHRRVPPTAGLEEPDEGCELDHVLGAPREVGPGAAAVLSSGFGGTNAALILRP